MCTEQRKNNGRVYEDDGIRDSDKRWADCLTGWCAAAMLLTFSEVVAAFEEQASDDGEGGSEASEELGDGDREPVRAGGCVA
jgi:hypothetical protein